MKPPRGNESLRRYRVTHSGTSYFVTLCTRDHLDGLDTPHVASAIKDQLAALETDGALSVRAAAIMPDHLHLFFLTTGKLTISQVVGRLKAKTRGLLAATDLGWQSNFTNTASAPTMLSTSSAIFSSTRIAPIYFLRPRSTRGSGSDRRKPDGSAPRWTTIAHSPNGSPKLRLFVDPASLTRTFSAVGQLARERSAGRRVSHPLLLVG